MAEIIDLINTAGFPIACVICLALYIRELTRQHKEEMDSLREQFAVLNLSMQKMTDKIEELIRKVCDIDED